MRLQSESVKNLYAALGKAQAKFPAIPKLKEVRIPGKYSFMYADLADIIAYTRPALCENGLTVTQPFFDSEEAGRKVLVTRIDHESGEFVEFYVAIPAASDIKQLAGNITYLKRYVLSGALGVAADEDTDGEQSEAASITARPAIKPPPAPTFAPVETKANTETAERDPRIVAFEKSGWKQSEVKLFIKLAFGKESSQELSSIDQDHLYEAFKMPYDKAVLKYGKKPGESFKPAPEGRERANPSNYEKDDEDEDRAWNALGSKPEVKR